MNPYFSRVAPHHPALPFDDIVVADVERDEVGHILGVGKAVEARPPIGMVDYPALVRAASVVKIGEAQSPVISAAPSTHTGV